MRIAKMTPTEQDNELREKLTKLISQEYLSTDSLEGFVDLIQNNLTLTLDEVSQLITADRKRVALEARIDPFEFVESCEPDCDDVRHAYHQGQWDMATRIEAKQEEVK